MYRLGMVDTINSLFSLFGGPAAVGRAIGKSTEHASGMKRRKSVPVEYWPSLIESEKGRELGLTNDDLVKIHLLSTAEQPSTESAA